MFIDIHCHKCSDNTQFAIKNLSANFDYIPSYGYFSIGMHPWYLQENTWRNEFAILAKNATNKSIVAIGECGLDKSCKTNIELQKEVFSAQIILANKINKPLIVHCVKAYDEVHKTLELNNNKIPVIFHGFNKKKELAKWLISKGYYLSFGKSIFQPLKGAVLKDIAEEKLFLETDDASITISNIYEQAANILGITLPELKLRIKKNSIKLFADTFLKDDY